MIVSKAGQGKTLTIKLSVFPCGNCDTKTNLTISCSHPETRFKTTLSEEGLEKFKNNILKYYDVHIGNRRRVNR